MVLREFAANVSGGRAYRGPIWINDDGVVLSLAVFELDDPVPNPRISLAFGFA